jgi:acetyl-CoA carboxylase alpha subunit
MGLRVPVVACVIGEGSSGGALAFGIADRVLMQQNAIYTVISPEGCAAILWKDASDSSKRKAAAALRPTADACLALGVVDAIVPEPSGGAHRDHAKAAELLGDAIQVELDVLSSIPSQQRRAARRAKFRDMGAYAE